MKLVDRTFNCSHSHAMEIWRYIQEHDNSVTNFHFEIAAGLLNEEELAILKGMRPGLVQLEIGVQTTNWRQLTAAEILPVLPGRWRRLTGAGTSIFILI